MWGAAPHVDLRNCTLLRHHLPRRPADAQFFDHRALGGNLGRRASKALHVWRSGTRVLPKVEGRVPRRSYRAGWQRPAFRLTYGGGLAEGAYLLSRDPEATAHTVQAL